MSTPSSFSPLVIRFGAFGDMLLLIPMLKVLHRRYGQPCEVISSGRWTVPLMQRVPTCGSVRLLTSRRAPYWLNRSQREFVAALRQRPTGPVYIFEPDEKSHSLLKRGGIPPDWICSLRNLPRQPEESIQHHALRLARETPAALHDSVAFPVDPDYAPDARPALSEGDRRDCEDWLTARNLGSTPLVLLQPGNKKTMRRGRRTRSSNIDYWPEHHWARVIEGVCQHKPEAHVLICGSPEERSLADDIVSQVKGSKTKIIIATDDLPIPRLLTLQARSHSMISVNTGPAHGAATMGCPLVVLFNRHEHRAADLYAPQSTTSPVKILLPDSLNPEADLSSIQPESVLAAWQEMSATILG